MSDTDQAKFGVMLAAIGEANLWYELIPLLPHWALALCPALDRQHYRGDDE